MDARQLSVWRDILYRRRPELRLRSVEEALAFVQQRGFVHFWPIDGVELPSLWQAVAGDRTVAAEHDDPGHVTWGWKDNLLDKKCWYYAKLLKRRGTMVALDTIPYFYALSENYGEADDYLREYEAGTLTLEAKQIVEALMDKGPMDTISLRREARLAGKESKGRFEKALVDLQVGLKILPTGVTQAGAWKYSHRYDLVSRWFPELPAQARAIGRGEARQTLIRRYLDGVGAATSEQVARLFGWSPRETDRALAQLGAAGQIVLDQEIAGLAGRYVLRTWILGES